MSDAKKTTPPPPPAEGAAPATSSPKWLPVMVGLNSLLLVGVLGFMGYSMLHPPAPAEPRAEDEAAAKGEGHAEAPPEKKKEEAKKAEPKKGEEGHGAKPAGTGPGPIVRLPDFVVHLRNSDLDRYARITFEIEVMAETDKDQLTAHLPRVRDSFIAYLSDRTVEELAGSEGLGRTKDALYARVRELVPEARFRALYISDFVVQ